MNGKLLSDKGIAEAIKDGSLEVSGLTPLDLSFRDSDSPIQAGSLDLTFGRAFEPPEQKFNLAELDFCQPQQQAGVKIAPGHSAVIETKEQLNLSSKISAFCFPPAHLARNALLMTNPGHVDPGYRGNLTFTVINLGREEIYLNRGMRIATLLVFRFDDGDVSSNYAERRTNSTTDDQKKSDRRKKAELLNTLSPDFGSFNKRVSIAAHEAVAERTVRLEKAKLWVPTLSSAVAAAVVFLSGQFAGLSDFATESKLKAEIAPVSKQLKDLETKLISLEAAQGVQELLSEVDELRNRVDSLQTELSNAAEEKL